ncbi:MAG TPA: response regulator [Trueperaceae bacterium]|nr:response regulator [Trueperaceae bacterium]
MSGQKPFIISIDDDKNTLKLIATILKKNYEVMSFDSGEAALEKLRNGLEPKLIICDIDMPELNGYGVKEKLANDTKLRSIPFIFLTALDSRQDFRKGMITGADDYLTKPFSPQDLIEAIETRLGRTEEFQEKTILNIYTLGGIGVEAHGNFLDYDAKKVIELIVYLIVNQSAVPLHIIQPSLWRKDVVENSLHVLTNRARKTFEGLAEFIVEDDVLFLKMLVDYYWDAQDFENKALKALKEASFSSVAEAGLLYKGMFLPDFESSWSERRRAYYDSLYFKLLEQEMSLASSKAEIDAAKAKLDFYLGN